MPQLGQGRNMVGGGGARPQQSIDLGNQIQERGDLGAYGGLSGLVSQLRGAYGGGFGNQQQTGPGRDEVMRTFGDYKPMAFDPNRGYAGNDPMFGPPLRGGGGDTFDPGGRSAATLQKQWSDLDPTAQQGYIKQYQAATPQMQASVLDAMGLGQRGRPVESGVPGVGGWTAGGLKGAPGGRSPVADLMNAGPMGPGATADYANTVRGGGLKVGGGLPPGVEVSQSGTLGAKPQFSLGGQPYDPGPGATMGRAPAAAPPTLGGGIGGLSGLAARPRKALGSAAQDYFG